MGEEGSEIPRHLKEGIQSVGAYEQEARRDYQIAMKAWNMRIPKETMLTFEGVRRYVGILRDLDVAGERFAIRRYPEDSPRNEHAKQVVSLHRACRFILEDGFPDSYAVSTHLETPLNAVAERYGAGVEEGDEGDIADSIAVSGLWTRRQSEAPPRIPWPEWERRSNEASKWWALTDLPGERHDGEHLAALAKEAQRQGLRRDAAETDPVAHARLARLVHARDVLTEITVVGKLPLPPGLTPSAAERLGRIVPLARLAVGVLQEEFKPGQLSPREVVKTLTEVGGAYGLVVHHSK